MFDFFFLFLFILNICIYLNLESFIRIINIYDFPDKKRKLHKGKVPLIGGFLLIINLIFYFFYFLNDKTFNLDLLIILTSIFLFIIGLFDDKYDLSPLTKFIFLGLIFSTLIYLDNNILIKELYLEQINFKIYLGNFSFFFTLLCFLLFLNALNMFDGINFQSLSYSIFLILILFFKSNNFFLLFIVFVLFFISFLNLKNKTYLGDSGIYILSFLISYFIIKFHNVYYLIKPDEIFVLMSIPGIDMLRLFVQRLLNKKNPFRADRYHLHHLFLMKFGYKKTIIFLIIIFILPYLLLLYIPGLTVIYFTISSYFLILFFVTRNQKNT